MSSLKPVQSGNEPHMAVKRRRLVMIDMTPAGVAASSIASIRALAQSYVGLPSLILKVT